MVFKVLQDVFAFYFNYMYLGLVATEYDYQLEPKT